MLSKFGRTITAVILAILAPLGASLLVGFWFSEGHGASLSRLAQVRPGMTNDQVSAILGRPGTINREIDGSESWYYTRGTFCQVKVYMSSQGLVSETDHDH
jgi:outer membrane protein assembly factor BamE (lipoprotein component of BamABCDE complex)